MIHISPVSSFLVIHVPQPHVIVVVVVVVVLVAVIMQTTHQTDPNRNTTEPS